MEADEETFGISVGGPVCVNKVFDGQRREDHREVDHADERQPQRAHGRQIAGEIEVAERFAEQALKQRERRRQC